MEQLTSNRLAEAQSAYLRSARHQPVAWYPWGDEAFAAAAEADKPILLDIGAVWCHWCHVMDHESYEDSALASRINRDFIAIKVDRDERPDVDTRYQAAVAAISGQSGWPLTAFLTPSGRPFFGGTYFPPEERYGRPAFQRVLERMAGEYQAHRAEVEESAGSVLEAIEHNESYSGPAGPLQPALLDRIVDAILGQFDRRNGGFGSQPKFPHAAALSLLIDASSRPGVQGDAAHEVAAFTLAKMAAGGIHDQLAGGFHRYSVDEQWLVPHFEKLAYDNSELLQAFVQGFQSFVEPRFARTAAAIIGWMDAWLTDRDRGGFYASQDADAAFGDDGDYFTWTRAEAAAALSPEEFEVAARFFDLRAVGDMQHNPAKNVLHAAAGVDTLARQLGWPEQEIQRLLESARDRLSAARLERTSPSVDRTIYTGWNGLCISAYLAGGRALALPDTVSFALRSLDRVLAAAWQGRTELVRVVIYPDGGSHMPLPAVLEDYAYLAHACLHAWEATGEIRYFHTAEELAGVLLARFYDEADGGFFDTAQDAAGSRTGALAARRKPVQDAPTPSGNAMAAMLLLRLHALTGNALFQERARQTLERFAAIVEHFGLYAASYGLALRSFFATPVQVVILGTDALADELAAIATARYLVNKSVLRLRPEQLGELPPALEATLPHLPGVHEGSVALVCKGFACLPPTRDPDALFDMLSEEL